MIDRLYDAVMAGLERAWIGGWRAEVWRTVPRTGRGLEIGLGTGANLPFYPPAAAVIATELRPAMLAGALRKGLPPNARPAIANAQTLPFRDAAFDWAVATLVFCEVPDPLAGLREVRRVLRPGATLALFEHVKPTGPLGDIARLATRLSAPLFGEHYDRETVDTVREAGFMIEQERRWWKDSLAFVVATR